MKDFSLQTVLRYRKDMEELAHLALSQAHLKYQKVEQKIQKEQERLQAVRTELEQCQAQGTDSITLVLYQQCLDQVGGNLHAWHQKLHQAEQEIRDKKQALYQARTDKKKLEKLKERHWQRAQAEENRLETNQMDEVAISRWGRSW